jgi:hypothetical protein
VVERSSGGLQGLYGRLPGGYQAAYGGFAAGFGPAVPTGQATLGAGRSKKAEWPID